MLRVSSKEVLPGDTYLALNSDIDGNDSIKEAIDKGAACVITDHGEYSVKTINVPDTRTYLSNYLRELYLEKFKRIRIIGIAGTSGKTITGDLLYQLLNNLNSKTAFLGTNGFYLNDKIEKTNATTPDIYEIYSFINKAIENDCENIIIEVSSKAIINRYIEGLRFNVAVFTNLFIEESENDINQYLNTKRELFKMLDKDGIAIINKKDPYYDNFTFSQNKNIFYGSKDSDYFASNISLTYDGTYFDVNEAHIEIPLLGSYNIYNFLAAYSTVSSLGYSPEDILSSVSKINQIDGRYQGIKNGNSLVIIDYAYNPDMIENVIKHTTEFNKGRLLAIFGDDGDKDKNLRPVIGSILTKEMDHVIFTTDNPRYENPEDIINEIVKGTESNNFEIIVDRKDAIKHGISLLENEDILLILGKGHEEVQIIGGDSLSFKDYSEVMKNIKRKQ